MNRLVVKLLFPIEVAPHKNTHQPGAFAAFDYLSRHCLRPPVELPQTLTHTLYLSQANHAQDKQVFSNTIAGALEFVLNRDAMPDLLTTEQAGEKLGVNASRVRQFILEGRLPAIKLGRDNLIREEDLTLVQERRAGRPSNKKIAKSARRKNKK